MANISESAVWEGGIYQIEVTDPVMGGADGIANKQAKQLGNRTSYLKQEQEGLKDRVDAFDEVTPASLQAVSMVAALALLQAKYNKESIGALFQSGEVMIYNRGVVSGCVVSKSQNATRNLSLTAGSIFYGARLLPVNAQDNCAVIPANSSDGALPCYCYLAVESGKVVLRCTQIGIEAPADSMVLYRVNIPAGNTAETDPTTANVTLTDLRRGESGYPSYYRSAAFAQVAFSQAFQKVSEYEIALDVVSYAGGGLQQGMIYVGDRATNGFKIYTNGTVDEICIRWRATRRAG